MNCTVIYMFVCLIASMRALPTSWLDTKSKGDTNEKVDGNDVLASTTSVNTDDTTDNVLEYELSMGGVSTMPASFQFDADESEDDLNSDSVVTDIVGDIKAAVDVTFRKTCSTFCTMHTQPQSYCDSILTTTTTAPRTHNGPSSGAMKQLADAIECVWTAKRFIMIDTGLYDNHPEIQRQFNITGARIERLRMSCHLPVGQCDATIKPGDDIPNIVKNALTLLVSAGDILAKLQF